eukprot:COSAG01_NODE_1265_length_10990_cov_23.579745_11_plen_83_part_00
MCSVPKSQWILEAQRCQTFSSSLLLGPFFHPFKSNWLVAEGHYRRVRSYHGQPKASKYTEWQRGLEMRPSIRANIDAMEKNR